VFERYGTRPDAILEGHIGGQTPEFEAFRPAPEQVRLIEVASAFGGAEWLLQEALQRGYRPAITGASDLHLGLLGAPRAVEPFRGRFYRRGHALNVRDAGFGSGPVGAILAPELTRAALWEGLSSRRTYATTGDRIFLHLEAGGHGMGEVADLPDAFEVRLRVHGETDIERIDLIVGDRLAASTFPAEPDGLWAFTFDRRAMPRGEWFYFRLKQVNNEFAWTAPIWFADGARLGDDARDWPPWNITECPDRAGASDAEPYLRDIENYLATEGDREKFGDILPVRVADETIGRCAVFISTLRPLDYPVTIRWFFEHEIPAIRVDFGYENFGVVDCQRGPAPPE